MGNLLSKENQNKKEKIDNPPPEKLVKLKEFLRHTEEREYLLDELREMKTLNFDRSFLSKLTTKDR